MNGEDIVALRLAHPFQPFTLVMKDGRRLPVSRAYFLAISPDRRSLVYSLDDGGFDWLRTADVSAAVVDTVPATSDRGTPV